MKKIFLGIMIFATAFSVYAEVTVKDYSDLGDTYVKKGDYQKAISAYQGGLSLDADNSQLLYKIGDIYYNAKENQKARDYLEKAVKADPNNKAAQTLLLKLSPAKPDVQQPSPVLTPKKNDGPQDSEALFATGDQYFKNGLYEAALNTFEKDNKDYYKNLFGAATCARFLGFHAKAIEYYKRLISVKPDLSEAYLGIGISYQLSSNFDSAIANFKKYLEFKKSEEVYSVIANICIKTKKYNEAKAILEEGIASFGSSAELKALLEEVYRK